MFPVLFSIGPFRIYTFGFLLAIGLFLFFFFCWRRLRNLGLNEEKIIDLLLLQIFWGFVFARLFFIIKNWTDFAFHFSSWILLARYPGLSFWGAIVGGILALVWLVRKNRWDFWRVADEVVFSFLPLAFLAQLGCFFNACILGTPTQSPWGLFFPGDFIRRQPVSLFSALAFFLIWIFLLRIERRWRAWGWYKSSAEGFITLVFLGLAFLANFLLAFWTKDRLYYLWLGRGASLAGLFLVLGIFYFRSGLKKSSRRAKPTRKLTKKR